MNVTRLRKGLSVKATVLAAGLMPTMIGQQDLAALIAQRPAVADHGRSRIIASPFGTIEGATFTMPEPLSAAMPVSLGYVLAGLDPGNADITGSIRERMLGDAAGLHDSALPTVNRRLKGDRLIAGPQAQPTGQAEVTAEGQQVDPRPAAVATERAGEAQPPPSTAEAELRSDNGRVVMPEEVDSALHMARLYFGIDPMGRSLGVLEPWLPGEAPELDEPASIDADYRSAALSPPEARDATARGGETIAPKGEVTGADKHPMSPAERLKLDERGRAKAEKCLTAAIYFEARGEPVRGQIAVAQVVMNRVFSGYYPGTVCGVVYQNANHHLACQFTFACDGIPDVVREPDAFERAKKIAAETLDGQLWLPEVGKATHYHAYWVHPSWVHEMTRMYKLGVHTFYRPKRWGDGAAAPQWGDAAATVEAAKKL